MKVYRIEGGKFAAGPGTLLFLSATQIAERKHSTERLDPKAAGAGMVRATQLIEFKVGEIIGLPGVPKGQTELCVEVTAEDGAAAVALVDGIAKHAREITKTEKAAAKARAEAEAAAAKAEKEERASRDVAFWTDEWTNTEALRKQHETAAAYVAARQAETARA